MYSIDIQTGLCYREFQKKYINDKGKSRPDLNDIFKLGSRDFIVFFDFYFRLNMCNLQYTTLVVCLFVCLLVFELDLKNV